MQHVCAFERSASITCIMYVSQILSDLSWMHNNVWDRQKNSKHEQASWSIRELKRLTQQFESSAFVSDRWMYVCLSRFVTGRRTVLCSPPVCSCSCRTFTQSRNVFGYSAQTSNEAQSFFSGPPSNLPSQSRFK